jgi:hypothetical protein
MYGRDFESENHLLDALDIGSLSLDELRQLAHDGYALQPEADEIA